MIQYDVTDGLCVLRLDAPPLHAITFSMLEELLAAVERAGADDRAAGIVITGDPNYFSAGADIHIFREIASAEDARRTSRIFQEAFGRIENSAKPVAAAVAGRVMGGALELAMACHRRVCTGSTRFAMPEVKLGINPGAGGTQRLPRLVGPVRALQMLLTGEAIGARKAEAYGLVDAVCAEGELIACARGVLAAGSSPRRTRLRDEKVRDAEANEMVLEAAQRSLCGARPEIIAPHRIIEAVGVGLRESFEAGLAKEQEAFAECMKTPATRNKLYLFFATRTMAKIDDPAGGARARVAKAAVVGMGSMGTGIAQALAMAGVPVVVLDEDSSTLERGIGKITASVRKRVEQGKLSAGRARKMLGLVSTTTAWQDLSLADLVIEAVFESLPVKRSVIEEIEKVCGSATIIASNTSTLSLDVLAAKMRHPERLVGMHFFNPAHRMPLVEIIRHEAASARAVATAIGLAKEMRKKPVLVRNRAGFLVNRIFIPYLKESFWLLEEGADAEQIDRAMVEFGFPMGPLALADMAGLDVLVLTDKVLTAAFPRHGNLSTIAGRLVEAGRLGQKSGSGVYQYAEDDYTPGRSQPTQRIIAEVQKSHRRAPRRIGRREIVDRLVLRMAAEAFYVVGEKLVRCESDVDAAMVLGTGFPDFRGGVLKYARDLGLAKVAARLDELAETHGERYSPCGGLREMKGAT